MARRRSARLAGGTKTRSDTCAAANLQTVAEREESPVDETFEKLDAVMSSPPVKPQTPSTASFMRPPMSEMHPSKVHPTTATPSSGLRLGFADINPSSSKMPGIGLLQSTPSKSNVLSSRSAAQSVRPTNLGPEAQSIMKELREETARIKAELAAVREQERLDEDQINARRIAQPKGKAGRFSAAHMSEFKKMDSIENHPSAFRASKFKPVTEPAAAGVKRSQSKANLNDSETARVKTRANLDSPKSSQKVNLPSAHVPGPGEKRVKQDANDDTSTNRPTSQDGSHIPRPKPAVGHYHAFVPQSTSTFARLTSPTQASLARTSALKTPTTSRSWLTSPSKTTIKTGLKKSATVGNVGQQDADMEEAPGRTAHLGRYDKFKSIFAKHRATTSTSQPGVPTPQGRLSKTPAPVRAQTGLPVAPNTTPGRSSKLGHVTPASRHAALAQNSPSPVKSSIPPARTSDNLVHYPAANSMIKDTSSGKVSYPDLSGYLPVAGLVEKSTSPEEANDEVIPDDSEQCPPSIPGTFTFRSDHTIRFDSSSPRGFGGHSGQASVRQVRPSAMPSMAGAFPSASVSASSRPKGKENMPPCLRKVPFQVKVFRHGVGNKKRLRVEDDEEEAEREAAERAAKRMRDASVPEGEAVVAPRLVSVQKLRARSPSKTLGKTPAKPPMKSRIPAASGTPDGRKTVGISMSRLSYLATPKQRK